MADPDTVLYYNVFTSPRTESDGVIDQIHDLSPTGAHATMTTTGRATYDATRLGGAYPAYVFDGLGNIAFVSAATLGAALSGATGVTIFLVVADGGAVAKYLMEYGAAGGQAGAAAGTFAVIANIAGAGTLSTYVKGNVGSNVMNATGEDLLTPKVIAISWDFTAAGASEVAATLSNGATLGGSQTGSNNNTGAMSSAQLAIAGQLSGANKQVLYLGALAIVRRSMTADEKLVVARHLGQSFGLPFADEMEARRVPRILMMGQSNALTQAESYTTLERWDGPHTSPRVWAYKDTKVGVSHVVDTWGGLREHQPSGVGWEGWDLVMCMELVRKYRLSPELIMVAEGATTLYNHPTNDSWDPTQTGELFDRLEASLADAIATHPDAPASPDPWVVWDQGESDSASAEYVNYGANLTAFIAAVRALPGMEDSKWVIVLLHENCAIAGSDQTSVNGIRSAQIAVAAADPLIWTVDPSDLPLQGDNVHRTEATYIEVGKRVAAVIGANT